jgi:hypothetical protein
MEDPAMRPVTRNFALAALLISASAASGQSINEIRIDEPGTDVDEYFELAGAPGASLTGLSYIVIGDGTTAALCGVIECVVDLGSLSVNTIPADGLFAAAGCATCNLAGYDVTSVTAIVFENSDNMTHMLVRDFTGLIGDDLDTNDDGQLDVTPWSTILDCVALIEDAAPGCDVPQTDDETVYCDTRVGPESGSLVPGHIYWCDEWLIGPFDPIGGSDTPGEPNGCVVPVEPRTWGGIKGQYR